MEVENSAMLHTEATEEKLKILEIQVAGLISDVIMLKAWKSEMSKLNLPLSTSCMQSEAVVPTSDIKEGQVNDTIMKPVNDQKATSSSGTSISCIQSEAVVPSSDVKQEDVVSDTVMEAPKDPKVAEEPSVLSIQPEAVVPTSNVKQEQVICNTAKDEKAIKSSETSILCIQPEAVVPTSDVNQKKIISDTIMKTVDVTHSSETSISCFESVSMVPTTDVNREEAVSDITIKTAKESKGTQKCTNMAEVPVADVKQAQAVTVSETANDQKPIQCSDTSFSCIPLEVTDVHQEGVVSDTTMETASDEKVQEHSDSKICISSSSTLENADTKKCKNETDLKRKVPALEKTVSISDTDTSVVEVIATVDQVSNTDALKEPSKKNSWIALIEEEEQGTSETECIPSEPSTSQSSSSSTSQLELSSSLESQAHGPRPSRIGSKYSVLEKLVKSAVQYNTSESEDKRNTAKQRSDRQKTDSIVGSPEKQKTELQSTEDKSKKVAVDSPEKQKSFCTSEQSKENSPEQKPHSSDKSSEVERNAILYYMMKQKLLSEHKKMEEHIMQDVSVTINEKECATCKCKIAARKDTSSEEEDSVSLEVVKKMSKETLEKKYLKLNKRHQKLVNAICDPNTLKLPDDPCALLNAARDGNLEDAILFTFNTAMMEFGDEDGYAPLHLAVWNEHIQICKLLLGYNMPASVKDNQGNTPLHFAARKGSIEICKVLLEWLAPVNAANASGSTPLHCAVKEGHAEVCTLLVSKGASVNLGDKWNNTALHMAALNGFLEICHLLISHGASVNVQNSMGITPLHTACKAGHVEVVKYLVKRGASLSIKCNKGKTPKEAINTLTNSNLLEWVAKWEKRICTDLNSILG